jgi:hypothetical protein
MTTRLALSALMSAESDIGRSVLIAVFDFHNAGMDPPGMSAGSEWRSKSE